MTKALAIAVALLLATLLGVGWVAKSQYDNAAYLKTENKALLDEQKRAIEREDRDRKVLVARQAKIVSQARKLAQAEQALSEALQRNKAWSDTDVPDDVQKALGGAGSGLPDGPQSGLGDGPAGPHGL